MVTLDRHVREMTDLARTIAAYTYPVVPTDEYDIAVLKQREIHVDGIRVALYYSRGDYGGVIVDTVSVVSLDGPFLPFPTVWKCGTKFLGTKQLALTETVRERRRVYVWVVFINKKTDEPVPNDYLQRAEECTFNGHSFVRVPSQEVLQIAGGKLL